MIQHPRPLACLHPEPCADDGAAADPRRAVEREAVDALRCNLGSVLDLSSQGMRIVADRSPQADVPLGIELVAMDKTLNLRGRVQWIQRVGQFKVECGISFERTTREQTRQLEILARMSRAGRKLRRAG
ncbi:MAG: PilZ domain-containing protein [Phycisphaerales bacterium]